MSAETRRAALRPLSAAVVPGLIAWLPLLSLLPAFAVASLFTAAAGVDPAEAASELIDGSLGTANGLGVTAINTTPLLATGLGVAIAIRAGLWNLGAEGQLYLGALGATLVSLHWFGGGGAAVAAVGVAAAIAAGFVAGAAWAAIPGLLRAYRGVNEVITSLLLTFVGINLVTIVIQGPLEDATSSFPASEPLPEDLRLPVIIPETQAHAGLLIAIGMAFATYILLRHSNLGLELRAVGHNIKAARFAGIRVRSRLLLAMLISGGCAGVAGAMELLGRDHRLVKEFSPGYGFDAVAVALLASADPRYIPLAAAFFGALRAGAPAMERGVGLPSELIFLTQGIIVLFVIAAHGLRARLRAASPAEA